MLFAEYGSMKCSQYGRKDFRCLKMMSAKGGDAGSASNSSYSTSASDDSYFDDAGSIGDTTLESTILQDDVCA